MKVPEGYPTFEVKLTGPSLEKLLDKVPYIIKQQKLDFNFYVGISGNKRKDGMYTITLEFVEAPF